MTMTTETQCINLKAMRENAGLSIRELARQLKTNHTNVVNWEKSNWVTKAEFIAPLSTILGVSIEELLALPKPRKSQTPGGKLGETFRQVSELPRGQQQKVIELAEAFIALHTVQN
jgi:transcriptional regulator with XRE-family HTH domain